MVGFLFLAFALGWIGFQIRLGTVFAGGNRIKRTEYPTQFWFVIALQAFIAAIIALASLSYEGWLGEN